MTEHKPSVFKFEDIEVRESDYALVRAGEAVRVEPTAFRVLLYLLRNPGRLVTKEEIMAAVWHDTAVSDNSLTRSVATLRRLLDDSSREPRFIATAQTLGYRFLCAVEVHEDGVGGVGLSVPVGITEDAGQRTGGGVEPRSGQTDLPGTEPNGGAKKRVHRWTMIVAGAAVATAALVAVWVFRERLFPRPPMREEQLTRNSNDNPVTDAAISGDGKYLAFSDIAGVHVRLLHTGETADISTPPELHNSVVNWSVHWLPDSTRFLAVSHPEGGAPSTWEASVVGGTLRKIRENAEALSASPDGSIIAYKTPDQHELWLVGTHGETPRKLFETGERGSVGDVFWSPDGARLLYGLLDWSGAQPLTRMESRDIKGGAPVTLLSDKQLRNILGTPDGRIVYVLHEGDENSDTCNYWLARMDFKTGRLAGEPKQLTHGAGYCMAATSATADGKRLVFLKQSNKCSVYVASLGPGAASITPPVHFTMTETQEIPAAWSADSQSIIFISNRDNAWEFYRQPLGGGPATPIVAGIAYGGFPRLSPDGEWLLWEVVPQVYQPGDKVDVMRVSMEGGTPQLIFSEPNIIDTLRCAQFPATLCAIASATPDRSHLVFTSFDPLRGRGRELMRVDVDRVDIDRGGNYTWALSPDGNRIALLKRATAQIRVLSLTTRKEVRFTVKDRSNLFTLDWTANGKGLFTSTFRPGILLHLDLEGHADVLWEPKGPYTAWALPSPDGRYVALPFIGLESNVWMLEDY